MIINMQAFTTKGKPLWEELDREITFLSNHPDDRLALERIKRLHYLYNRTCADLSEMRTYGVERDICSYLEALCARAYSELHAVERTTSWQPRPRHWLRCVFPQTVRRYWGKLAASCILTLVGVAIGSVLLLVDPGSKEVLLNYSHLSISPSERVAKEEAKVQDPYKGRKLSGSVWYLTHNTRVSYMVMASGISYGILTFLLLFSNGLLLGAVCTDYIIGGEGVFLTGWLLPHGSVEIPGILIAGQAGLIIAGALLGGRTRMNLATRLRQVLPDITTLAIGIALMMGWAGIIEAVFSQYHEPVLPYGVKISFGAIQLLLVIWYFSYCGRNTAGATPVNGEASR